MTVGTRTRRIELALVPTHSELISRILDLFVQSARVQGDFLTWARRRLEMSSTVGVKLKSLFSREHNLSAKAAS